METDNTMKKEYIIENILRKRRADEKHREEKYKDRHNNAALERKKKKEEKPIIRAELFVKKYRRMQSAFAKYKRRRVNARKDINSLNLKPDEDIDPKLILVLRVRGHKDIPPVISRILKKSLRVPQYLSASFVKLNKYTLLNLKRVGNYITYGIPSKKTVTELVVKRGHGMIDGKRVALNSNELIEQNLGSHGIICVEDIVHELMTLGEGFDDVVKFLCSFKLAPTKQLTGKMVPILKGGDWGDRGDAINDLIAKMI